MNEQQKADAFNEALDRIMQGGTGEAPEAVQADVTFAASLASLDVAAESGELRRALRQKWVGKPIKERVGMTRRIVTAGIVVGIVLVGLLAVPPLRSFAQSILREIGGITLTGDRTLAEQIADGEQPEGSSMAHADGAPVPTAAPPANLSGGEVAELADFEGWLPTFVPDGYEQISHYVAADYKGNPLIMTGYTRVAGEEVSFFTLDQMVTREDIEEPFGRWDVGNAEISDVTVNGTEAVFVEGANIVAVPDDANENGFRPAPANILIWTADGFTFTLVANDLGQAELIAVAESVQAP